MCIVLIKYRSVRGWGGIPLRLVEGKLKLTGTESEKSFVLRTEWGPQISSGVQISWH
jgi:hypothetical protein